MSLIHWREQLAAITFCLVPQHCIEACICDRIDRPVQNMDIDPNPNPTLTVFHDIYLSYDDQRHNDGILDEEQSWQRTEICRYLVNGPRMVVSSNVVFHWQHLTKEGSVEQTVLESMCDGCFH